MPENAQEISVFLSWQSDTPENSNRYPIRDAIKAAAKKVRAKRPDLKINYDDATRGKSGSPNVVETILEKIRGADIFVADITTVRKGRGKRRACANPNVVFELGYAVAELGWNRIILLFNTKFGKFPDDLPFDFKVHRASQFSMPDPNPKDQKITEKLEILMYDSITAVIDLSPARPSKLRQLTTKELHHQRDAEALRWFMGALHLPTLDDMLNRMPHIIPDRALWFFENAKGVFDNSLFHVFDRKLRKEIQNFMRYWNKSLSFGVFYHQNIDGSLHIFTNPMDMPLQGKQETAWNQINKASRKARQALDNILARVRDDYVELDIIETNQHAWSQYLNFKKETEDAVGLS